MKTTTMKIQADKPFPGNPNHEVILYKGVFTTQDKSDLRTQIRDAFVNHGWSDPWEDGVYSFEHFHAEAHEVLGCAAGWVEIRLGGPNGDTVRLEAGDVALLPAGVAHRNMASSDDYLIMGSYPPGQSPDLRRGDPEEWDEVVDLVSRVPDWTRDPVTGEAIAQV